MGSPSGKVVASIALPSEAANATTYCGPAEVTISGTGVGAAAVAEFDSKTRRITGITVVSPGTGYDDTTTATIESPGGVAGTGARPSPRSRPSQSRSRTRISPPRRVSGLRLR